MKRIKGMDDIFDGHMYLIYLDGYTVGGHKHIRILTCREHIGYYKCLEKGWNNILELDVIQRFDDLIIEENFKTSLGWSFDDIYELDSNEILKIIAEIV